MVTLRSIRCARSVSGLRTRRHMGGFTFLILLAIVAIMGIGLLEVNELWSTTVQREKEQELLFIGHQFRQAFEQYNKNSPKGIQMRKYPGTLEDLLIDPRYPEARRYLRRIYTDPMTGKDEWGLQKYSDGGIYGVYSLSKDEPVKHDNFDLVDAGFKDAKQYSSWIFAYNAQLGTSSPAAAKTGK